MPTFSNQFCLQGKIYIKVTSSNSLFATSTKHSYRFGKGGKLVLLADVEEVPPPIPQSERPLAKRTPVDLGCVRGKRVRGRRVRGRRARIDNGDDDAQGDDNAEVSSPRAISPSRSQNDGGESVSIEQIGSIGLGVVSNDTAAEEHSRSFQASNMLIILRHALERLMY